MLRQSKSFYRKITLSKWPIVVRRSDSSLPLPEEFYAGHEVLMDSGPHFFQTLGSSSKESVMSQASTNSKSSPHSTTSTSGYAARSATTELSPFQFERRAVGKNDVKLEILFCGICHSDVHQVRNEWGGSVFPMVPGHEIVGKVIEVGSAVTKFKIGDLGGVGCFVDSCRTCGPCKAGEEQYCEKGMNGTYNSKEKDGSPTYGGYSKAIVVDENYMLRVPKNLPPQNVAPLLCAGITTYSPLKHWNVGPGSKVAVVGLGGLGHMGVKIAAKMGAEVTVLSHSDRKLEDAKKMGAQHFEVTSNPDTIKKLANQFDFILNTVSAVQDIGPYLNMLKLNGAMVLVGLPEKPTQFHAAPLIMKRRSLAGSLIGGIRETQEMLDFCSKHEIAADIEVIPIQKVNEAYERMGRSDVRYRFVIDLNSLQNS